MKLRPIAANQAELTLGDARILFSYSTPVAYAGPLGCFQTDTWHSNTTDKHINQWGAKNYATQPQGWFDSLVEGVK